MQAGPPFIQINADDARRIAKVGRIRLKLANRIVKDRESRGYFEKPSDLARVKGISNELASDLSSRIVWTTPEPDMPHHVESTGVGGMVNATCGLLSSCCSWDKIHFLALPSRQSAISLSDREDLWVSAVHLRRGRLCGRLYKRCADDVR